MVVFQFETKWTLEDIFVSYADDFFTLQIRLK